MTVEEAKKILEKEGFKLKGPGRAGVVSKSFTEYESHEICEAMQIVCSAGYEIMMLAGVFEARKARLRLELTENTKTPGPGEEQPKEKKGIIYPTTFPKADFHYYKHVLNEGNPALKESASQFNDALLDEQAKEIERLKNENAELLGMVERMKEDVKEVDSNFYAVNKENKRLDKKVLELIKDKELMKKATLSQLDDFIEIYNLLTKESQKAKRLGKEIARLNKNIYKKNLKIKELRKESSRHLRGKIKMFGENVDLEQMLKDKNAVLSDVAEELRLSEIREKNLVEVSQKYTKENEELKKELANKVVNKIDAQALKSAESALAYKDEVIETLEKELAEAKHELSSLKRPFRPDSTEAVVLFANAYAKAERKHLPCTDWRNDGKEVSATYILENGKKSKIALDFTGDEIIFSRTDPDKPRKDSLYSYKDKQLAEKDEMIADLGNELAATKKELEEKTHLVEIVRNASKDYCDYGVAANEFIKKLANLYVIAGSKGTISNEMFERCKSYQTYVFPAKFTKEAKKEIDGIARGNQNMKK